MQDADDLRAYLSRGEILVLVGGSLHVVLPFEEYRRTFATDQHRDNYDQLLARVTTTLVLPRVGTDEDCYWNAGKEIVHSAWRIVAVWDGRQAKGLGGTGDVVAYAHQAGRPTRIIDPVARRVSDQ